MDGWEIALLILAAYLAVFSLARMMIARRQYLLKLFRRQLAAKVDDAASAAPSPGKPARK